MKRNSRNLSPQEMQHRINPKVPLKPYGYGIVRFGPYNYRYFVENKKGVLYIAFEGKNDIKAIANRDNVHRRACQVFYAAMELTYERNAKIAKLLAGA